MFAVIDFESRSKAIIQETGAWRYCADPSTEPLCLAYAIENAPVELWVPGEDFPADLRAHIESGGLVFGHHVFFEFAMWTLIMTPKYEWPAIPKTQWRCSAAMAAYHALPRSLDQIGRALSLKHVKDTSAKRVMMKLSRPRTSYKDDPAEMWSTGSADYKALYQYCKDDVAAERDIHLRLKPLPPSEQAIWGLDQAINERGIQVDMPAVRAAIALLTESEVRLKAEFLKLTGIESPTMVAQFKKWLSNKGCMPATLNKNDVAAELSKSVLHRDVWRPLQIRQALSRTSTAKYQAIVDSVCKDDRLRGLLMYHGASTGRWTGQLVQPQNLPRNTFRGDLDEYFKFLKLVSLDDFEMVYGSVAKTISQTIRGVFIPAPGHVFVGGDYNAIEARVLFWLASENRGLQMFRENQDLYKDMAGTIYQKAVVNVTKQERELGKRGILGCGYGMGHEKFQETCRIQAGLILPEGIAERAVNAYRSKYSTVVALWKNQETAAKQAIETKKPVQCGKVLWGVHDGFLFCRLPSGRCLAYYDPEIEMVKTSWGEMKAAVTHMGTNSVSRQWERQSTYGGKIVENITQAVARDIMANAMLNCEEAGYKVTITVHDELLTELEERFADSDTIQEFENIMTTLPAWAEGLPVKAEGWTGGRYKK